MQRFCYLAILMVLSSSAYAGNSFSFTVGGHHIQIEAPRNCNSASCISVSIPGVYRTGSRRERDDDDNRDAPQKVAAPAVPPASVTPPASAPVCAPPVASKPPAETVASIPVAPVAPIVVPAVVQPQSPAVQQVPAPTVAPSQSAANATPATSPTPQPAPVARPAPETPPRVSRVSHEIDDEPTDTPLGDWQTEGNKGTVRIERCGESLCGYVLDISSNKKGETILIDMKPKALSAWSGNIYSRDSGNTYYATIAMKGPNSLRVEACALGHFFCSGNVWSRIDIKPMRMMTYRQISSGT